MNHSREFVRNLFRRSQEHDISGLAAELSYRLFVAAVPVFAFLAALGAAAASALGGENPAQSVVEASGDTLPSSIASNLESELGRLIETSGFAALAGTFAGALWGGALAMGTVVKAAERIHDSHSDRPRLRRWLVAVSLSLGAGGLLLAALVGLLLSELYHERLAEWAGFGAPSGAVVTAIAWLAALILVVASAALLYRLAAPAKTDLRWVSLGAIGFGAIWLLGSAVFLIYVTNFTTAANTYGILGAILIALAWLYFSSFAFLLGKEMDVVLREQVSDDGPA
jgi:membrane protein